MVEVHIRDDSEIKKNVAVLLSPEKKQNQKLFRKETGSMNLWNPKIT